MAMKRFMDITDFTREELRETLNQFVFVNQNKSVYASELKGKTIINAFFKENNFVKASYEATASRTSGSAISYSHTPGRTLKDEVTEMSALGDVIVLSHPKKGAARAASLYSRIPVINAGDGGRAYPVRTLADIATVSLEKKHVSNMKIGFLGDFSDNAPAKGLLQCLNLYKGNEFYFVSVNGKPISDAYVSLMDKREKPFEVYNNLFDILPELDVLYMTRVDKSSFDNEIMYESRKHNFVLDERMLMIAKPDLIVMHPFPRGEELDMSVDGDHRVVYFRQMGYFNDACLISLIKTVSNKPSKYIEPINEAPTHEKCCGKEDCITSEEGYLPPLFFETEDGRLICKYCMQELSE